MTTSQVDQPEAVLAAVARVFGEGSFRVHRDCRIPRERVAQTQALGATARVADKLLIGAL